VNEHQPFLNDDEDDTLLFEKLQEHVLENHPNPERIGCLDRATLETWIRSPEKLNLADPKYLHVLKCAECTRDLIELRKRRKKEAERIPEPTAAPGVLSKSSNWRWAPLAATFALCCVLIGGFFVWRSHITTKYPPRQPQAAVSQTIDLSDAGTPRGGETSSVALVLPRQLVTLHLILPYYSPGGPYRVAITADRLDGSAKAEGDAIASAQGQRADVTVNLDLRNLAPGTYYLATTHDGDPASYFYPLTLR
jgi:hypothetical protein